MHGMLRQDGWTISTPYANEVFPIKNSELIKLQALICKKAEAPGLICAHLSRTPTVNRTTLDPLSAPPIRNGSSLLI